MRNLYLTACVIVIIITALSCTKLPAPYFVTPLGSYYVTTKVSEYFKEDCGSTSLFDTTYHQIVTVKGSDQIISFTSDSFQIKDIPFDIFSQSLLSYGRIIGDDDEHSKTVNIDYYPGKDSISFYIEVANVPYHYNFSYYGKRIK